MDSHDSRDLDRVIDDVARAMTSAGLARDLQPAVASRIASPTSWALGWRAGLAAAAVAAVVLAVVVMRPERALQQPVPVGDAGNTTRAVAPPRLPMPVAAATTTTVATRRQSGSARAAVGRQTIDNGGETVGIVEIRPLAIVPLADEGVAVEVMAPPRHVEIAPIDVSPVRINQLGELLE